MQKMFIRLLKKRKQSAISADHIKPNPFMQEMTVLFFTFFQIGENKSK